MGYVYRCENCGGDVIPYNDDSSMGECEYCGSRVSIPKVNDNDILRKLKHTQDLWRKREFDKAYQGFEKLIDSVHDSPKEDAVFYWSALLCEYGIEYVQDEGGQGDSSFKPAMHRMKNQYLQSESYFAKVMELATEEQRNYYQEKALEIDLISERYQSIINQIEPYDVFISYKEKDAADQRTNDSCIAEYFYVELKKRGYNVFFARETLKEIAGEEYEPYIFSALKSAKVMLLYASSTENINATWVQNEWKRFLYLQEADATGSKHLLPVISKMDPSYLPRELSNIQAVLFKDMNQVANIIAKVEGFLNKTGSGGHTGMFISGKQTFVNVVRGGLLELAECKLKDAKNTIRKAADVDFTHFGNNILNLVYYTVIAEQLLSQGKKNQYLQAIEYVKRYRMQIKNRVPDKKELSFYRELSSSDACAMIRHAYQFAKLSDRVKLVEHFIQPNQIFSSFCGSLFLNDVLEEKDWNKVNQLLTSSFSMKGGYVLRRIVEQYPNGSQKLINIKRIIDKCNASTFTAEDMIRIESFFDSTETSVDVKYEIMNSIYVNKLPYSIQTALRQIGRDLNSDQAEEIITNICTVDTTDEDIKALFFYCMKQTHNVMKSFLNTLIKLKRFCLIDFEKIKGVLESEHWSINEKIDFLETFERGENFAIDTQGIGLFTHYYICESNVSPHERLVLIETLLNRVPSVQGRTVEQYAIKNLSDGEDKLIILQLLLDKNENRAAIKSLLQKYVKASKDPSDVKARVFQLLISNGFAATEDIFDILLIQELSKEQPNLDQISVLLKNGTEQSTRSLDIYLEKINKEDFSSDFVQLLYRKDCRISDNSINRFVLEISDQCCIDKVNLIKLLTPRSLTPFGKSECIIEFKGNRLRCNLLQAYTLLLPDSDEITNMVVAIMLQAGASFKDTSVVIDSQAIKWKKFVTNHKGSLEAKTISICENNGVFKLF